MNSSLLFNNLCSRKSIKKYDEMNNETIENFFNSHNELDFVPVLLRFPVIGHRMD
jgi:hypothetical protein